MQSKTSRCNHMFMYDLINARWFLEGHKDIGYLGSSVNVLKKIQEQLDLCLEKL